MLVPEEAPINLPPPRQVTTAEAIREFMQSLLPWRNTDDAVNDTANVGGGANAIMQDNQGIVQELGGLWFRRARNTDEVDGQEHQNEDGEEVNNVD